MSELIHCAFIDAIINEDGILPFLTDDDDVEMPVVEDVCHSYETIRRLVSVIQLRFYFTLGWKPSEGADSIVPTFDTIVDLIPESQQSCQKLKHEAEEYIQELAGLREIVFNQQNGEYENDISDATIAFPCEIKHRIVVFGGHDSWLREIRQKLPDVRFLGRESLPNADLIRNADVVWIQANSLAHKHYYKIIDIVRKYNKPVRYFAYASATKCAEQIVLEDREE